MSHRIGRNEKCYCGSGKKYKLCHLHTDQQRQPNALVDEARVPFGPVGSAPDLRTVTRQIRELADSAPANKRAELEKMLESVAPIVDYMERQESVEAASTALEQSRDQFIKFSENKEAYLAQAQTLFAEESFAPLRFTAAEVGKAMERVGYIPSALIDDDAAGKLRDALLSLTTRQRRRELSLALLSHLPHYVAAGRVMDGWIIQSLANDTVEFETQSNPFLFSMFAFGYDDWIEAQRRADEAILRDIGIDPAHLQNSSLEEIDEWMRAHGSDPAIQAKMDKALKANPQAQARTIAQLQQIEHESALLLEGEDASELLLTENEVGPWLPLVLERWRRAAQSLGIRVDETPSDEAVAKIVKEAVYPLLTEMVQSIFTRERVREFISKLREFRNKKFAAGDKAAVRKAFGAVASLERETEPQGSYFLVAVCFISLRKFIHQASSDAAAQLQEA